MTSASFLAKLYWTELHCGMGDFLMAIYTQFISDSLACYFFYLFMVMTHILV